MNNKIPHKYTQKLIRTHTTHKNIYFTSEIQCFEPHFIHFAMQHRVYSFCYTECLFLKIFAVLLISLFRRTR